MQPVSTVDMHPFPVSTMNAGLVCCLTSAPGVRFTSLSIKLIQLKTVSTWGKLPQPNFRIGEIRQCRDDV